MLARNLAYLILVETGRGDAARELCRDLPELHDPEEDLRRAAALEAGAAGPDAGRGAS